MSKEFTIQHNTDILPLKIFGSQKDMDSHKNKSVTVNGSASACRRFLYEDDGSNRPGAFDYFMAPLTTANRSVVSLDLSQDDGCCKEGNTQSCFDSTGKEEFEKLIAKVEEASSPEGLSNCSKEGCSDILNSKSHSALKCFVTAEAVGSSIYDKDAYNALVLKNNTDCADEVQSCKSEEDEDSKIVDESDIFSRFDQQIPCHQYKTVCQKSEVISKNCRKATDGSWDFTPNSSNDSEGSEEEFKADGDFTSDWEQHEYNSLVSRHNTEQFDEVLSVSSDGDLAGDAKFQEVDHGYHRIETRITNSEYLEHEDPEFQVKTPTFCEEDTSDCDPASYRFKHGYKSSAPTWLERLERSSNGSAMVPCSADGDRRTELLTFISSNHPTNTGGSWQIGHHSNLSDESDNLTSFSERDLKDSEHCQTFASYPVDLKSERGMGDYTTFNRNLISCGKRNFTVPQYKLVSRNGSDSDPEQPVSTAQERYFHLKQRRIAKKERDDASMHKSTDVPDYKGHLDVDELLNFINGSKNEGFQPPSGFSRYLKTSKPVEKSGVKKKKTSNTTLEQTSKGKKKQDRRNSESSLKSEEILNVVNVCIEQKDNEHVGDQLGAKNLTVGTVDYCDEKYVLPHSLESQANDNFVFLNEKLCLAISKSCDVPEGGTDIKTVTVERESCLQSTSSSVLYSTTDPVLLQYLAISEDEETPHREENFVVVKKKKKVPTATLR